MKNFYDGYSDMNKYTFGDYDENCGCGNYNYNYDNKDERKYGNDENKDKYEKCNHEHDCGRKNSCARVYTEKHDCGHKEHECECRKHDCHKQDCHEERCREMECFCNCKIYIPPFPFRCK